MGRVFIDLTPLRKPEDIVQLTLAALDLVQNGREDPKQVLLNYLRNKELLLIFDNFEHVLPAAALLAEIVEVAPNITIIATTREQLNLRIETAYYLQPITDFADMLFLEVAAMMRPDFTIDEREMVHLDRVVELIGGLPLGLILAATWVDILSIEEIAEEIEVSLDFLRAEMGDMPDRQRSIHAVIEPSWKRLSEKDRKTLMWASVFCGGFTREAFQKVTAASVRTIQTLLRSSLINAGHGRRYDMHPLIRQFAREKLKASGELQIAKKVHLETFLTFAETQNELLHANHYLEWVDNLHVELGNFRAALDWSLFEKNYPENGVAMAVALMDFWEARSHWHERNAYLKQCLAYQPTESQLAYIYAWLGRHQFETQQPEEAAKSFQKGVALAEKAGDADALARNYVARGLIVRPDGFQEHLDSIKDFLQMYETDLSKSTQAQIYNSVGIFAARLRDIAGALVYFERAVDLIEETGNLFALAKTLGNVALCYDHIGDAYQQTTLRDRTLAIRRQIGDRAGLTRSLPSLAWDHLYHGKYADAVDVIDECRDLCLEFSDHRRLLYLHILEGVMQLLQGNMGLAQAAMHQGQEYLESADADDYRRNQYYVFLGLAYLHDGKITDAQKQLQLALAEALRVQDELPTWLTYLLHTHLMHQTDSANDNLPMLLATLHHHRTRIPELLTERFLDHLIEEIQQQINADAWQATLEATSAISLEAMLNQISEQYPD